MTGPRSFVLRHGLPGCVGTALVAVGALGVGWLPLTTNMLANPLVDALRSTLSGSLAARAMVIVGLAILLQAWLVLGSELLTGARSGQSVPTRDTVGVLAWWAAPLLLAPPLFSRDVYSYYVQGRVYGMGYDPTTTGISVIPGWFDDGADPMWVESPTPYGPLFLMVERTVATFAHPNAYLGALLFRLAALIGVALIVVYVPRLARSHGIDPTLALWLGVLNPVVIMHFIAGAHNDALMVGLVVMGLALASEQKCIWGAVAVSLAVTVKPIALIALPFVGLLWAGKYGSWWDRIRSWLFALLVLGCTLASVFLVADAGQGVIKAAFGTPSGVLTWLSPATAIGQLLGTVTTWLGITSSPTPVLTAVRLLGTVLGVLIIAWLILRPGGRSPVRGAALALATVVILGPVVQPWYLLWFLPLFAATGFNPREFRVAMILTALFTVHGMIESSANADNLTDVGDSITFLVAILVVVLIVTVSPRERRLVLGNSDPFGLEPHGDAEREQALAMTWTMNGRIPA